jgi:hypothetical protein
MGLQKTTSWGLKVPGRPPTPSEGAAQVSSIQTLSVNSLELTGDDLELRPYWSARESTAARVLEWNNYLLWP